MKLKKTFVFIAAFALVFSLAAGCAGGRAKVKMGKDGIHVETEEGTVDIVGGEDGGSVKVRSKDGDVDIDIDGEKGEVEYEVDGEKFVISSDVDLESLGVPVYPGARVEGGNMRNKDGGETMLSQTVGLKTEDPISKVAAFYRENLKGARVIDMLEARGSVVFMLEEDGGVTTVAVTRELDEKVTDIVISVIKNQ